jgi:hypothetical protein
VGNRFLLLSFLAINIITVAIVEANNSESTLNSGTDGVGGGELAGDCAVDSVGVEKIVSGVPVAEAVSLGVLSVVGVRVGDEVGVGVRVGVGGGLGEVIVLAGSGGLHTLHGR